MKISISLERVSSATTTAREAIDQNRRRKKEKFWTLPHLLVACLFIFLANCWICRWCFLERAQYAQKSESKPSHHTFYPSGHKYKALFLLLLLLLLCVVLSHYRCRFSAKRMHFFSSSTHTSIHQMRTSQLFEQNKNLPRHFSLSLSLAHTHIHTDDGEKIAAGREKRTRLSILRNHSAWAHVYARKRTFCFYYWHNMLRCEMYTHPLLFSCFYSKIHSLASVRCSSPRPPRERIERKSLPMLSKKTIEHWILLLFSLLVKSSLLVAMQSIKSNRLLLSFIHRERRRRLCWTLPTLIFKLQQREHFLSINLFMSFMRNRINNADKMSCFAILYFCQKRKAWLKKGVRAENVMKFLLASANMLK